MYPPVRRYIVISIVLLVCAVIFGVHHARTSSTQPPRRSLVLTRGADHTSAQPSGAGSAAQVMVVDVAGAVRQPGVYELAPGARVVDAIRRAGGLRRDADTASVNRAARIVDGQQVIVAARPDVAAPASGGHPAAGLVSINAADAQAFDTLQGIGPVTAQHIVDDRQQHGPFATIDDLDRVPGVGAATIEAIRSQVTL